MAYNPDYSSALGLPGPGEESYIFGKPAWRKGVPLFLLLLVWLPPLFFWKWNELLPADADHPATAFTGLAIAWLAARGVTLYEVILAAAALSLPLLLWLYTGLERLIVTPTMIIRGYPFLPKRRILWADLDEVLIDHLEARFEDETTARKTMTIYSRRGRFIPWRRRMKVNNRQFDGFEEVERIAVAVGVPAIADRIRQELEAAGKPARFPLRTLRERFAAGLLIPLALALVFAGLHDPLWSRVTSVTQTGQELAASAAPSIAERPLLQRLPNPLAITGMDRARPFVIALGALLLYLAFTRLWYQQIAIDYDNVYILRRGRAIKTISLDSIADIQVLGNVMRIYGYKRDGDEEPRMMWKTRRFIQNRGVLLCLIRDIYDSRRTLDLTPIVPMRSLPASPQQKQSA